MLPPVHTPLITARAWCGIVMWCQIVVLMLDRSATCALQFYGASILPQLGLVLVTEYMEGVSLNTYDTVVELQFCAKAQTPCPGASQIVGSASTDGHACNPVSSARITPQLGPRCYILHVQAATFSVRWPPTRRWPGTAGATRCSCDG